MVFSSPVFVFLFLPLTLLLSVVLPKRWHNAMLLLMSLIFYAWGEPVYVLLMLASSLINWQLALRVKRRGVIQAAVIINIGLLVVFKYTDFLLAGINSLTGLNLPLPHLPLPIGISFYTFQALSYVIDVYRDEVPAQPKYARVLLYIVLFPQLIAGPIVRYADVAEEIASRSRSPEDVAEGMARFVVGFARKLLLANNCALIVDRLIEQPEPSTLTAWLIAIAYALQIFFDFAGYSDMAIGLGRMFGFHFKENFAQPYRALGVQDFWRRWHMSLTSWFRSYVYIPLGGNRRGTLRTLRNRLVVFTLTGLWHGANLTFLVWGLFHGLFLMLEHHLLKPARWPRLVARVYTLLVAVTGFVIFRADTLAQGFGLLGRMFWPHATTALGRAQLAPLLSPWALLLLVLAAVIALLPPVRLRHALPRYALTAGLWLVCLLNLSAATYNPFIYFRF
ncbi:MAG: MBOAT family O-acyltransferase [Bacillota bacterium]|nr:MBOAT family O-acyltransferase [Bacillota bacterium]